MQRPAARRAGLRPQCCSKWLNVAQCCAPFTDAQHWGLWPRFGIWRSALDHHPSTSTTTRPPEKLRPESGKIREFFPALGNSRLMAKKVARIRSGGIPRPRIRGCSGSPPYGGLRERLMTHGQGIPSERLPREFGGQAPRLGENARILSTSAFRQGIIRCGSRRNGHV